MQTVADQPASIKKALDTIEAASGHAADRVARAGHERRPSKRPITWRRPGFKYTGDYVHDDEPSLDRDRARPTWSRCPYTFDMNDITVMALQTTTRAKHFYERGVDQFAQLHKEGAKRAKIMPIPAPCLTFPDSRTASSISRGSIVTSHAQPGRGVHGPAREIYDWFVGVSRAAEHK